MIVEEHIAEPSSDCPLCGKKDCLANDFRRDGARDGIPLYNVGGWDPREFCVNCWQAFLMGLAPECFERRQPSEVEVKRALALRRRALQAVKLLK